MSRIAAIITKELRQLARDKLTFGMVFGIPIVQLLMFGYAINTDVRHISAAVADQSRSHLARQAIADLEASQVIDIAYFVETPADLEELLRTGKISIGVHIPEDFEQRVQRRQRAYGQLLVDGSDPTIVSIAARLTTIPIHFDTGTQSLPPPGFELRPLYNPERRSAVNIVPGLIGVILTMTMVMFTAVAIVRERERGNLEFLINTPVKSTELMLGKVIPYVGIGLLQVTLILFLGAFLFDVPIAGSFTDLYLAAALFIAANLTLGLLISTAVQTQFQAMQAAFFIMLPSILLSGFMFPFDGMPRAAQIIAFALPLTHFLDLVRGIMLRGAGLGELLPRLAALSAFTLITMTAAILRFSKRLD